jgi:protein-tyrosine phosphatase
MNITKILDNLYLGSSDDERNLHLLLSLRITHIVTVGRELVPTYSSHFQYLHIKADDDEKFKLDQYFDQMADFINNAMTNANGTVLVHCKYGISRSASTLMAYLIKYNSMTLQSSYELLYSKRLVNPNRGFLA